MMTDWSTGVESRNYRIAHRTDARNLADLLASISCILIIAGALIGYVSIRIRIVSLGYSIQQLEETEKSLRRAQNNLILEEETLKQPQRIDYLARTVLAMEPMKPNQLILNIGNAETDGTAALALASTPQTSTPPKKPASNN